MKRILRSADYLFVAFFMLFFTYFLFFANHVFYYQSQSTFFAFDKLLLYEYISYPGGLLKLISNFISAFYIYPIAGSAILTLIAVIVTILFKRLTGIKNYLNLLPALFIWLLNSHYLCELHHSLAVVLMLSSILIVKWAITKNYNIIVFLMIPMLYYIIASYMFLCIVFTIIYLFRTTSKYMLILILLVAIATPLTTYLFTSDIPINSILYGIFPQKLQFEVVNILTLFMIVILLIFLIGFVNINKIRYSAIIVLIITVVSQIINYDKDIYTKLKIDKAVYDEDWGEAINLMETNFQRNKLAIFNYNYALLRSGKITSNLFSIPQYLGVDGFILKATQESSIMIKNSELYYELGYFNEAHRWAFESMVANGLNERALRMLVMTNIVNEHYSRALKYIALLEKTIFSSSWASEQRQIIESGTADVVYKYQISLRTDEDYLYNNDYHSIYLKLLASNPDNKYAMDCLLLNYLLINNTSGFYRTFLNSKYVKSQKIPVIYEEALLVCKHITGKKVLPEIVNRISSETKNRFKKFATKFSKVHRNANDVKRVLVKDFGNTYWYYVNAINRKPLK